MKHDPGCPLSDPNSFRIECYRLYGCVLAPGEERMIGALIHERAQLTADINRQLWRQPISPTTEGTTMTTTEASPTFNPVTEVLAHPPSETIVERPPLELQNERLVEEVRTLKYDLELLCGRLVTEARNRGWCSEYDEFVRNTNEDTYGDWLQPMERELEITVSFNIGYSTIEDEESVAGAIRNRIRSMLQDNFDQDEPSINVRVSV